MRITILVGGRFHAFELAEELEARGYLSRLITSYPKWKVTKNYSVQKNKIITSNILKELIGILLYKLNLHNLLNFFFIYLNKYFENFSSKNVDYNNTDIIIGWSGFSYKTFIKSQEYKILKICERGSSHIMFQAEILKKEYEKFNLRIKFDERVIEKELKEYKIADYISVPSTFAKNSFLEKGTEEKKIILIPYGVELKDFFRTAKKDKIFRFISVGTIGIRKGSFYTLKAFDELKLPNCELLMIGNIENEFIPFKKQFNNNKKIKFIKHVNQRLLVNFYNQSDVFVISSIEDGFAMVILQALACGLPVICSANSGGSDKIEEGKHGFILNPGDINSLKEKMNFFFFNPENLINFKKNVNNLSPELSWKIYGNTIEQKYKDLLKKNFDPKKFF